MKLTLVDLLKVRDKVYCYTVKTASFDVTIINARTRYGTVDALIQPVSGEGAFWVELGKLNEKGVASPVEPPVTDLPAVEPPVSE